MSETVKIIVTLSKGQYEALKDTQFGGIGSRMVFNAVKNGTPLDDVKAEIEKLDEGITSYHNDKPWVYESEVLGILDFENKLRLALIDTFNNLGEAFKNLAANLNKEEAE